MPYLAIALIAWLAAATIAHWRAFRDNEEHAYIFASIGGMLAFSIMSMGLEGARGLFPIAVALALPASAVFGIAGACKAGPQHVITAWLASSGLAWFAAEVDGAAYKWAIFVAWIVMALAGWITALDPYERPEGLTRWSTFALAASLLADLPGVYSWVRTDRWIAESALSVVSAVALATLPTLWRLRTSRR